MDNRKERRLLEIQSEILLRAGLVEGIMNLAKMAESVGQTVPFLMNLQKSFNLPPANDYSQGYKTLVTKLVNLTLCRVPQKDSALLLTRERKLLELLKADSLYNSPLWFEDLCRDKPGPHRLLLSSYDLGHHLNRASVQAGLDFAERERELFAGNEMGENALLALQCYIESREAVLSQLRRIIPTTTTALKWARKAGKDEAGGLISH